MPARHTTLTGAAGEHYVAYVLSLRGYIAALTRGGTPSVDILCSSVDGKRTLAMQVKTMGYGYHDRKRKPEESHYSFDAGWKAVGNRDNSFLYAFVSLHDYEGVNRGPSVRCCRRSRRRAQEEHVLDNAPRRKEV